MIRAALFDFDGTLADSFAAITASTNHVRERTACRPLPEAEVRRYVGHGLRISWQTSSPNAPADEAVALYRDHHQTVMFDRTRPMPGVARTIPELARRGFRLGVCSNKRVEFTRTARRGTGLRAAFRRASSARKTSAGGPSPTPPCCWRGSAGSGFRPMRRFMSGTWRWTSKPPRPRGCRCGWFPGERWANKPPSPPARTGCSMVSRNCSISCRECDAMLFALLLFASAIAVANEASLAAILACPKVSVPRTASGTGVIIGTKDGNAYLLTAAHVIGDYDAVSLVISSRDNFPQAAFYPDEVKVLARWPDPDVALITFASQGEVVFRATARTGVAAAQGVSRTRAEYRPRQGPRYHGARGSYPRREFIARDGKQPAFFWQTEAPPQPGRSGGPLLDGHGRVIGIAVAKGGERGYYAHHDEIVAALKRTGHGWLVPPK